MNKVVSHPATGFCWRSGARQMMRLALLVAMSVLMLPCIGVAAGFQPLIVEDPREGIHLAPFSLVLQDSSHALLLDDILTPERQLQFAPHGNNLEFGYTDDAVWITFILDNRSQVEDEFLLEVGYPLLDSITLYEPVNGPQGSMQWLENHVGDTLPFHQRPLQMRTFVFKLRLPPGEVKPYFMRVVTTSSLSVPLMLYSEDVYLQHVHNQQTYIGIFYGICFGLLAYNLFLYVSTREKSYLLYLGVVLSNVYAASCFDGFNYSLLPWFPYWQSVAIYVSMCITLWFSHQFSRDYLQTKELLPRADHVLRWLSWLSIAEGVTFVVMPGKWLSVLILVTVASTAVIILATAVMSARSGYQPAKLFLVAWVVMLSPVFVGVLNALNILSFHEFTPYIHKTGVAGEMIILSLALASRINILKQAEQDALRMASSAEAETRTKSDFLAKMSHEIRTPMNGVLGMAELLKETPLKPNQIHYVRTIYNSGQALLTIINDILDFSKMEAGKLTLEEVEFNLEELLDECVSVFALRSSEQRLPLIALLDPAVPRRVKGDPTRLRQVIVNLLGNAFKFTEHGDVRLMVHAVSQARPWLQIRCEIIDSGIGISADEQQHLFKSFSQADGSTTRKYGGTGLGLAICKELVELMGGEIGVDSQPGLGSCFWFSVELETSEIDYAPLQLRVQALSGKTLLLVEDNAHLRNAMTTLANAWGLSVLPCHSGRAALDRVATVQQEGGSIDVALLDLSLSDMNGIELSRRLLTIPDATFPCILITAPRQLPRKEELEGSRISMVLEKPVPAAQLRASLIQAVAGLLADADTWFDTEPGQQAYAGLRVLVAEDNDVNQLVVIGMLKRLGISPEIVNNGKEAVAKVKAASAPYDAILMDCEMPELDGYDATRQIRQHEHSMPHRTHIIALTAHAVAEHIQKSSDAGMDDLITKPLSIDALKEALNRVIATEHAKTPGRFAGG